MAPSKPELYLVDANSYVYRAFFALPALTGPNGAPTNAAYGFTTMILKLLRLSRPTHLAVVFDAPGRTFRDEVYAAYKANRPAMPDDLVAQLPLVHEITEAFAIRMFCVAGVEADDVIATLARRAVSEGVDVVVVTSDKDLTQIVGNHVRVWDTMRDRWFDQASVVQRFGVRPDQIVDLLGLMGDSVDNIPGVRGIGEKTARSLLDHFGSLDDVLSHVDQVAELTSIRGAKKVAASLREEADVARVSRDLARVRTDVDVEFNLDRLAYSSPGPEALRPVFSRLGFQKLLNEFAPPVPLVPTNVAEIEGDGPLTSLLEEAQLRGVAAWAVDSSDGELRGSVVGVDERTFYVASRLAAPAELLDRLIAAGVQVVAHDLKRDLRHAGSVHVDTRPAFDVMLASYLLGRPSTHRLEELGSEELGIHIASYRDGRDGLAAGVGLLLPLRERLRSRLADAGSLSLFQDVEMPLVGVLARMEAHGVCVDVGALASQGEEMGRRLGELEREIYALAGGEFNIGSPPQLREILFERLGLSTRGLKRGKTGLSTDVDALTRLATQHPLPAKILEYRGLAKLKSTYVDALQAAVNPATGRLHTNFNQAVAATGRLSSSDPNLQSIPVRGEAGQRLRSAFIAAEGFRLVVADYSQIELRVLAHLSGDAALVSAFRTGADIHASTASEVFHVLPGLVSREMRRTAKVINFGIVYGMGAQALSRELSVSVSEAERYIEDYFGRYPGVRRYLEEVRRAARTQGFVSTVLGRRRMIPELASGDRNLVQAAERTATNTPIQGSAADLIKLAMVRLDERLRASCLQASIILQVHDELVVEVAERDCETVASLVRQTMENVLQLEVPLVVDVGIGGNWAAARP